LIRHGATDASAAHPQILQGSATDSPLSAVGERQAEQTAQFLTSRRIDALFCSPMKRARQTAAPIAAAHGIELEIVPEIIEADLGRWELRNWDEIARDEPREYQQFIAGPDIHAYGGGESIAGVRDRALPAIERVMAASLGKSIAIVTHRIVIRACVAHLLGVPLAESRRVSPSTCGVSLLRYSGGKLELVGFNSVFHLGQ
jgi:probable phosphoglycerate mutase